MSTSILMVGNFLSSTAGTRGVCEDLALRLHGLGWPVVTTSSRLARPARLLDMVVTTWRQRRRYQVAQVDVYSGPAFSWAETVCWTLRKAKKPYVLTLHGGNLPAFAERWPRRIRMLLGSAAAVTTPSAYLLERMRGYHDDLHLLPNPIDLATFRFRPRVRPRPRLIWLRAFHRIYNPAMAPRVLSLLAREFLDVELVMIGPDKGDGSLQRARELAHKLDVAKKITWTGPVLRAGVPGLLDQADIFLNTPYTDNTPVSVLEAMAAGLCIVTTDVGGIPYLLEAGAEALLTSADDAEAMASAIRRLLIEPGLAERLSIAARRKAETHDWPVVLAQWEPLLQSIAKKQMV